MLPGRSTVSCMSLVRPLKSVTSFFLPFSACVATLPDQDCLHYLVDGKRVMARYVVACRRTDQGGRRSMQMHTMRASWLQRTITKWAQGEWNPGCPSPPYRHASLPLLQQSAALSATVRALFNCTALWWCSFPCCYSHATAIIRLAHISYSLAVLYHPCMQALDS